MNTSREPKPAASQYWPPDVTLPPYAEPTAEIAYGCVEWFCYDKHQSPSKERCDKAKKQ